MVLNNIEKLLEKYENAETSINEEKLLKNYFSQENVAAHLEIYKPMFVHFVESKQDQFNKTLPLKPIPIGTKKAIHYKWIAVAAMAVFMLGYYFKTPVIASYEEYAYGTYNNPEEALNEVTKQLAIISTHLNKGVSTVTYLNEVEKGTETLGYLNEIKNATGIIFKK